MMSLFQKTSGAVMGGLHVLVVFVLLGVGVLLFRVHDVPAWVIGLSRSVPGDRWGAVLGVYLIGIVASHMLVHPVVAYLRTWFAPSTLPQGFRYGDYLPPVFVGACETVLYVTAMFIGKSEFVAVWLGIKVAGSWDVWKEKAPESRARFQIFLIGNALSIMTAFVVAKVLRYVITQ